MNQEEAKIDKENQEESDGEKENFETHEIEEQSDKSEAKSAHAPWDLTITVIDSI